MKTVGIIAEYNPFHNGHQYQIEQAKALTGAEFALVVMSGDYMERGLPAIYHKSQRARAALLGGADLVLEMPVFGSVASARDFADCGISLLAHTGIVDFLSFGSESGDLELLKKQAQAVEEETPEISRRIKAELKAGASWPKARALAYRAAAADHRVPSGSRIQSAPEPLPAADAPLLPETPNDILGTEYLRAIKKYRAAMEPVIVKRQGPGYHSEEVSGSFASATAARKAIEGGDQELLKTILPEAFFQSMNQNPCPEVSFDDFSLLLNHRLLMMTPEEIENVGQMPKDLAKKLYKNRLNFKTASRLVADSKDRQYTYTRVNRCLLNLLLGITKEDTALFQSLGSAPWLRILGFKTSAAPLLKALSEQASVPVLSKTADWKEKLPEAAWPLFEKNLQAAELYRLISEQKTGISMKNEYTRPVISLSLAP